MLLAVPGKGGKKCLQLGDVILGQTWGGRPKYSGGQSGRCAIGKYIQIGLMANQGPAFGVVAFGVVKDDDSPDRHRRQQRAGLYLTFGVPDPHLWALVDCVPADVVASVIGPAEADL